MIVKFKNIRLSKSEFYMYLIVFGFTAFLFFIGWSRHHGLLTSMNDMGHYDQAIWGITKKGFLLNTSQFNIPINKLGFHFDPILYIFTPFYLITPTVNWLIFAQAFALSISVWPIFRLATHYTQSETAGVLWGLIYLVNPFFLNAATWDFHPITLAVPFVALAALAVEKKHFYTLLMCCMYILSCKEHFGIMVAGFGLLWVIRHRELQKAMGLVCLGIFHFILVIKYIMPAFSPTGSHVMISNGFGQLSRYTWIIDSFSKIGETLLHNPSKIIETSFFTKEGLAYIFRDGMVYLGLLILPFLGLPLLGASFIIPSLGDLSANLLSANPLPRAFFSYHSVGIMPLFCAASIRGSCALLRWRNFLSPKQLAAYIFIIGIVFGYILSNLPLPMTFDFWGQNNFFNHQETNIDQVQKVLGPQSSVSIQANIGPHFSQREKIYTFPNKVGEVDFIVLNLQSPTIRTIRQEVDLPGTLASHLQLGPIEYLNLVQEIIKNREYKVAYWKEPWLVLGKLQDDQYSRILIDKRVDILRQSWSKNQPSTLE